ncbi:MAG: DHH family phosphoesterase [Deltaproteobacteria bacterium]|jgi:nanoRNase/pAp phosphatase (c-di-AMP/oligoRNAs hydrolase)|nr:DHH family phosphoesterase [Deltaproteobacteria bacterium]
MTTVSKPPNPKTSPKAPTEVAKAVSSKTTPKSSSEPGLSQKLKSLFKVFCREDKVLIIISADPDSLASSVALKRLLWRRVSQVTVASVNQIRRPDNLRLVKALKLRLPLVGEVDIGRYDKLVAIDSQPHHSPLMANLKFHVVIDHHPIIAGQENNEVEFVDIRPDYGATATILSKYLKAGSIRPNLTLATALFYAIKTDTQNFVRQGQLEDMVIFRWLYPLINQSLLSSIERAPIARPSFKVMLAALGQAVFKKNYVHAFVEKLDHADTLVLAADFLSQINGVNRVVVSGAHNHKLVIVMRSAGGRSNLGHLAKKAFGAYGSAGGHKNMARAEIDLASLEAKLAGKNLNLSRFVVNRLTEALSRKPRAHDSTKAHDSTRSHGEKTDH